MIKKSTYNRYYQPFLNAVLNSYGMLFFSKHRFFSLLIFVVSFFVPAAGAAGFMAVSISVLTAYLLGFDKSQTNAGLYTYSAILFGLGFSSNFEWGKAFFILLFIGSVLTMLLSVAMSSRLNKKNIPGLSLAFIFTTWIILLASKQFAGIGLTQRHIYWVNETYAIGGQQLVALIQQIENWKLPPYISGYFKSMSAIIFQGNIAAGIFLCLGLMLQSRISFLLSILGYTIAILFNHLMGGFTAGDLSYYNMGTNFMLVAIALGGFYLIPSARTFLWTLISVPIAYLLVVALGSITYAFGLPVFSLPFCLVVILFLYCLQLRKSHGKLATTPIQYYQPETNLYRFLNGSERLTSRYYLPFELPIMGEWMVSQGYDGSFTHKGDWSKALDFVILDYDMKTFALPGNSPENFYCFNKPVISPADGIVEDVIDYVEDNPIGKNNSVQNWGNTIIIKHGTGLYSKLSHLKQYSAKVSKGSFVKKGEIIASCGNSGRSPEPHLHFQIQNNPYLGSKTTAYPIAYFYSIKDGNKSIHNFSIPREGDFVSNITPNTSLQKAFNFQPGQILHVASVDTKEQWEVMTDVYNESYFYCSETNSYAYFVLNGPIFYFSNFIGNKQSLLYYFFLSAYKLMLSTDTQISINDQYPMTVFGNHPIKWIQDFIAPFHIFIKLNFESSTLQADSLFGNGTITLHSQQTQQIGSTKKSISNANITIENNEIKSIQFNKHKCQINISFQSVA